MKTSYFLLWFSICTVSSLVSYANAATAACQFGAAIGSAKIPVVFFGGYQSTSLQVQDWQTAASRNSNYNSTFSFEAHSLNMAKSEKQNVLSLNSDAISSCADAINSPSFKGPVVLVGHSDGGWVINEIARLVTAKNKNKIKLVSLDGYAARGADFQGVDVRCWTSFSAPSSEGGPLDCSQIPAGAMHSAYTDSEMKKCDGGCMAAPVTGCHNKWCLHFSLVNENTAASSASKSLKGLLARGYSAEKPPLQFLDNILSAPAQNGQRARTPATP